MTELDVAELMGECEPLTHRRLVAIDEDVAAAALSTLQAGEPIRQSQDRHGHAGDVFNQQ